MTPNRPQPQRLDLRSAWAPIPPAVWNPPPRTPIPVPHTPQVIAVPELRDITEVPRQARRRAERGKVSCSLCLTRVPPGELVFADGKDAHRACAETLNEVIIEMREQRESDELPTR